MTQTYPASYYADLPDQSDMTPKVFHALQHFAAQVGARFGRRRDKTSGWFEYHLIGSDGPVCSVSDDPCEVEEALEIHFGGHPEYASALEEYELECE